MGYKQFILTPYFLLMIKAFKWPPLAVKINKDQMSAFLLVILLKSLTGRQVHQIVTLPAKKLIVHLLLTDVNKGLTLTVK